MVRKRHSDEDILKLLREIELKLTDGNDVASACRSVGIGAANGCFEPIDAPHVLRKSKKSGQASFHNVHWRDQGFLGFQF
jgi:hypothetical protein